MISLQNDTFTHRLITGAGKLCQEAETGPVFHSPDLERVCDYSGLNLKKPSDGHPRNYRPSVSSGSASGEQKINKESYSKNSHRQKQFHIPDLKMNSAHS